MRAVQAQAAALTAQLDTMMGPKGSMNPASWNAVTQAVARNSDVFRAAANSSGMWEAYQQRVSTATDQYINKLERQRVTFRDVIKDQGKGYRSAYREQLRLQNMFVRELPGFDKSGRKMYDLAIPTEVHKSWDTWNQRIGFATENLKSASIQMVNWGKNTQWTGRQLTVGFTMPLLALGAASGVMAYQIDKEMTRIQKVYDLTANVNSDAAADIAAVNKEMADLQRAAWGTAEQAATDYGVAAKDTLSVQAELAAQGKTGAELQEATNQVMRIATLGEFDHADALKTVTALQSIMGYNTKEVADSLNYMNSIENATSLATMDFAKAIPIALGPMKEMGGDLKDLALLLVAMKERGIEAGEGANAIKSMMQRLYRPSKQIREEWQKLADIDLVEMVQSANGDIMKILPQIADAVRDLSRPERVQLLGGLFGTYQVARQNAILKGLDDMNKGIGQTASVLKVNEQGWRQWGDTADRELKRIQDSASGRFRIALERIKIQLAEMGQPFLEMAGKVLTKLSDMIDFFAGMPDGVKTFGKWAAIITAMAGPAIMLVGLGANILGMFGRMAASIIGLGSNFTILNRETAGTNAVMKLAERGMLSSGQAASFAAVQVAALADAMRIANASTMQPMANPAFAGLPVPNNVGRLSGVSGRDAVTNVVPANAKTLTLVAKDTAKIEENTAKAKNNMVGMGVSAGVFAGAMAASVLSSNKTVDNIAQMVMLAAILLPAFGGVGQAVTALTARFKEARAAQATMAAASAANAASTAASAGAASRMAGGIKAGAVAFAGMMGPVGWTLAAVTAIGAAIWWSHKRSEEAWKKEYENAQNVNGAVKTWAKAAGKTLKNYESIAMYSREIVQNTNSFEAALATYQNGGTNEKTADAFSALSDTDQISAAQKTFVDFMQQAGMSAEKAQEQIMALFVATGMSLTEASDKAREIREEFQHLTEDDWGKLLLSQSEKFSSNLDDFLSDPDRDEIVKSNAQEVAEVFSAAFANADVGKDANKVFETLGDTAATEWQGVLDKIKASPGGAEFLSDKDISNARELAIWYGESENAFSEMWQAMPQSAQGLALLADGAQRVEQQIVRAVAETLHLGDDIDTLAELQNELNVAARNYTYKEAIAEVERLIDRQAVLIGLNAAYSANTDTGEITQDETRTKQMQETAEAVQMAKMNAILFARGLKEAETPADALYILTHKIPAEVDKGKNNMKNLDSETKKATSSAKALNAAIDGIDFAQAAQGAMSDVQSQLADIASTNFQNQMDAALDAYSNSQQSRIDALASQQQAASDNLAAQQEAATDALERRQEAATNAFEARWERRTDAVEAHFDDRIDRINKAIEAEENAEERRKKIFEAEMARIQRANETANANIDFNVALDEGNLDEAARIRNDMAASSQSWSLEDQDKKAERRSKKITDRLGKQIDKIEELKDKRLEALDKIEEAERRALERSQERQTKALQAQQEAAQAALEARQQATADALQTEVDNNIAAQEEIWENRKLKVDQAIALFQAYVPRNEKDLRNHIKNISSEYTDFNVTTTGKFNKTAVDIEAMLSNAVRVAANSIRSDVAWEAIGADTSKRFLAGALGMTPTQFVSWMKTGKFPESATPMSAAEINRAIQRAASPDPRIPDAMLHSGGLVGKDASSRRGVARTAGLHPSEKMTLLRDGEFVVNKEATEKHLGLLRDLNSDAAPVGGGGIGHGGFVGGAIRGALVNSAVMGITRGALDAAAAHGRKGKKGSRSPWGSTSEYAPGAGGWHIPAARGGTWGNTHDYATPIGTPLYAVSDGTIVESRSIHSGGSTTYPGYPTGWTSYGETVAMRTASGDIFRWAHMSPGTRIAAGQTVKGGTMVGKSGMTGNASGPHVHMDVNGNYNALGWLASHGLHLKRGTQNVKWDNTIANLHKGEAVLTEDINKKFHQGVENFANGGNNEYNLTMHLNNPNASADEIARAVIAKIKYMENRKPRPRRGN